MPGTISRIGDLLRAEARAWRRRRAQDPPPPRRVLSVCQWLFQGHGMAPVVVTSLAAAQGCPCAGDRLRLRRSAGRRSARVGKERLLARTLGGGFSTRDDGARASMRSGRVRKEPGRSQGSVSAAFEQKAALRDGALARGEPVAFAGSFQLGRKKTE